jgi:multiple sugar transport system permease protein
LFITPPQNGENGYNSETTREHGALGDALSADNSCRRRGGSSASDAAIKVGEASCAPIHDETRSALILTHVAMNLPMAVWLMMSFFKALPPEIEEAALVDGCHPMSAFRYVTLPLVVPGLIATGVLSFIFSWNEFTIALNLTSQANATVPVVVSKFANDYEVLHSQMAAASILATIPALLLMFFGQRYVVQGLTLGSVK